MGSYFGRTMTIFFSIAWKKMMPNKFLLNYMMVRQVVGGETTAHKVLRAGYYWTTLFRDAHAHAQKCQICQVNVGRERMPSFPLHPVTVQNPFEQWGLDIVGEINPKYCKLHKCILMTIDYFSKWTKAIPLSVINDHEVI